jgi:hypothetical protein
MMDWEQKFEALNNLDPCALKMRGPGVWYVLQSVEIKTGQRMSCVGLTARRRKKPLRRIGRQSRTI